MATDRPPIPAQLDREVRMEAGYRCAIPRCGADTVVIHHIDDYAKVKEHRFENLLLVCPNCHDKLTRGVIDRKAATQIKANLSVLNRYGDIEKRVLRAFADAGNPPGATIELPGSYEIQLLYLLRDGLLVKGQAQTIATFGNAVLSNEPYALTEKGREFVNHWLTADPLR